MKTKPFAIALVAVCTILTAIGSMFFKLAMSNLTATFYGIVTNWHLMIGLAIYGVGLLILLFALKHGELSVLYPIIALTYIWSLLLAAFILHEHVSIYEIGGVLLILLGVSAIGKGSSVQNKISIRKESSKKRRSVA